MGSNQSNTNYTARNDGDTVLIERKEIPEEYANVQVSSNVINRVNNQKTDDNLQNNGQSGDRLADKENIKTLIPREDKPNVVESRSGVSESEIEAKKAVFKNAAKRVEDRFFKFQHPNECERNEESVIECLNKNKNTPLNCSQLAVDYDECIRGLLKKIQTPQ
uniref:CHCH domain-containing protein n=1 Tax=Parastrongyloides trichosuri TaxID=131310 RepID=A0A0N5A1I4_PARTI